MDRLVRLYDVMSFSPVSFAGIRDEAASRPFRMGPLMDRVRSKGSKTTLLTDFDASHSGTVVNIRCYPGLAMRDSTRFWTEPYLKPVLEHHTSKDAKPGDPDPKTYGRIRMAEYVQLVDNDKLKSDYISPGWRDQGSGFTKVQAGITDPGAIEELLDGRFLTVSQGSDTDHLFCSACGSDWALKGGRCDHMPGQRYQLQDGHSREAIMFFVTGRLFYDHLAKCVKPAQPYSTVLGFSFADMAQEYRGVFDNGEVLESHLQRLVLIDSLRGVSELILESTPGPKPDPTISWSEEQWAKAHVLTALADAGRLKDGAVQDAVPTIEAFRSSERRPDRGAPRFLIGPQGVIPVHDLHTAKAVMELAEQVRGAEPRLLIASAKRCMDSLVPLNVEGDSTMKNSAQKWAEVVEKAEALESGSDDVTKLHDWSEYQGDLFEEARADGEAEERGVAAGIIARDAKLSTASRKALPDSAFCGPNRSFPVHDAAHVRNALARLPQSDHPSETKAKILACVRRAAKKHGVTVSKDTLEYNTLVALWDKAKPADPVDTPASPDETTDQKTVRLEASLATAKARLEDAETKNRRLLDQVTDLQGELKGVYAQRVFDLRVQLGKPDVKTLDSEEKRQNYLATLKLRTSESLRDSLADLGAEIDKPAGADLRDQDQVDDPTANGGNRDDQDKGKGKADPKPEENSQLAKFKARLTPVRR